LYFTSKIFVFSQVLVVHYKIYPLESCTVRGIICDLCVGPKAHHSIFDDD